MVNRRLGHSWITNGQLYLSILDWDINPNELWTDLPDDWKHPLELFFDAIGGEKNLPLITSNEVVKVNRLVTDVYKGNETKSWIQF